MRLFSPCPHSSKRAAGFTLIELMVVMLLISIILGVAIPRFDGSLLQDPAKQLTRRMINTVRALRGKAVQNQQILSLIIDLDNQRLQVAGANNEEDEKGEEGSDQEKAIDLPPSVRFVEVQFPQRDPVNSGIAEIFFYPAGYSDHVILHVQKDNQERFSYLIEPLLPKVKLLEEWTDF